MKFKSLTMKIWVTFTTIILLIIFGITLLYTFAYRVVDVSAKKQDLIAIHNMILGSDLQQVMRFERLQNLRESAHILYADGRWKNVGRPGGNRMRNDREVEAWLTSFANGEMKEKVFKEVFDRTEFIFIISSVDDSYLISYMPILHDNQLFYIFLVIGGVFILVGFFASRIVAKDISKPLRKLEDFTRQIAAKNFKAPIYIENQDEIGRLAHSMNNMQADLKRADEEEKMFLQSISHDLKTPVMVIMSHADAILDDMFEDNPKKAAQIIKDESINLNKKIKKLLYFNTLAYSLDNQSKKENIELADLIENTVSRLKMTKGYLAWSCQAESVTIFADYEKITVAIENILDNAIRYAKSRIDVSLEKKENRAYIEIFNDGKHIDPDEMDKIFENMHKDRTGNFGLGLAISKKIIEFYGGQIKAENRENGVCFSILL